MQAAERSLESPVRYPSTSTRTPSEDERLPVSPAGCPGDTGQYLCIECNETFDDKLQLNSHRQSHVAKKPFMCSHCGRGFHHQVFLQMHERSHEEGVPGTQLSAAIPSSARGMSTRSSKAAASSVDKVYIKPRPDLLVNSKVEFNTEKPRCPSAAPVECVTRLTRGKDPPLCKVRDAAERRSRFEFRVSKFSDTTVHLIDAFGNSVELLTEVFSTFASTREGGSAESGALSDSTSEGMKTTKMDSGQPNSTGQGARESYNDRGPYVGQTRRSTSRNGLRPENGRGSGGQPSGQSHVSSSPGAGLVSSHKQFESSSSVKDSTVSAKQATPEAIGENSSCIPPEVSRISDVEMTSSSSGDLSQSVINHKEFPKGVDVQAEADETVLAAARDAELIDCSEIPEAAGVTCAGAAGVTCAGAAVSSPRAPSLQNSEATEESRPVAVTANVKPAVHVNSKDVAADIPVERGFCEGEDHAEISRDSPGQTSLPGDPSEGAAKEHGDLMSDSGNGDQKVRHSGPRGGDLLLPVNSTAVSLLEESADPVETSRVSAGDVKLPERMPEASEEMSLGDAVSVNSPERGKPSAPGTHKAAGGQFHPIMLPQNTEAKHEEQTAPRSDVDIIPHTVSDLGEAVDSSLPESSETVGEYLTPNNKEQDADRSLPDLPAQPPGAKCIDSLTPSVTSEGDPTPKSECVDLGHIRASIPESQSNRTVQGDLNSRASACKEERMVERDAGITASTNRCDGLMEARAQPGEGRHISTAEEKIPPEESEAEPAATDNADDEREKGACFTQPDGVSSKAPAGGFTEPDSQPDGCGRTLTDAGSENSAPTTATLSPPITLSAEARGGPAEFPSGPKSVEPKSLSAAQVPADTPDAESLMQAEDSTDSGVPAAGLAEEKPAAGLAEEKPAAGLAEEKPAAGLAEEKPAAGLAEEKPASGHKGVPDPGGQKGDTQTELLGGNLPVSVDGGLDVLLRSADDGCLSQVGVAVLDLSPLESSEPGDKEKQLTGSERDSKSYLPQPLVSAGERSPTEQPDDASAIHESERRSPEVDLEAEGIDADNPPVCSEWQHRVKPSGSHSHCVAPHVAPHVSAASGHRPVSDKMDSQLDAASTLPEDRSLLHLTGGEVLPQRLQPQEPEVIKSQEDPHEGQAEPSEGRADLAAARSPRTHCLLCKQKLRRYRGESPALLCYKCRQRKKRERNSLPGTREGIPAEDLVCQIKQEPCEETLSDGLISEATQHEADAKPRKMYNCHQCDQSFRLPALLAGHVKSHSLPRCLTCGCQMRVRYKVRRIPRRCQDCVQQVRGKRKEEEFFGDIKEEEEEEKSGDESVGWETFNTELEGGRTFRAFPRTTKAPKHKLAPAQHWATEDLDHSEHLPGELSANECNREDSVTPEVASLASALPKLHKCSQCGMSFKRPAFLIKHVRKHSLALRCTCHLLLKQPSKKCLYCREQLKGRRRGNGRLSAQQVPSPAVRSALQCPPASPKESSYDDVCGSGQIALAQRGDIGKQRLQERKFLQKKRRKKWFSEHAMERRKPSSKGPSSADPGKSSRGDPDLGNTAQILTWEEGAGVGPTSCDKPCKEEADEAFISGNVPCKEEDVVSDCDGDRLGLSDKPHVCQHCGKSFQRYKSLHLHELVHTGLQCESCGCRLRIRKGGGRRSKKCRLCKLQEKVRSADAKKATSLKVSTLGSQKKKKVMMAKGIKSPALSELKKLPKGVKRILVKRLIRKPKKERSDSVPMKKRAGRKKAAESSDAGGDLVTSASDRVAELEGKAFGDPAEQEGVMSATSCGSGREGTSDMSRAPVKKIKRSYKSKPFMIKDEKPVGTGEEGKALPGDQTSQPAEDGPVQCPVCGQSFADQELLCAHQQSHADELPFRCTQCPQRFPKKPLLKIHILTHVKERPHRCPDCNKSFAGLNHLTMHRRVHMGLRPYSCADCPMSFRHKVSLLVHRYTHTKAPPVSYQCSFCGKSFVRSDHLEVHQRVHTGECPFRCQECDKTFPSKARLAVHSRVHLGVRPHSCPHCERSFIHKANLERHQQKHTGKPAFSCTKCDVRFPSLVMLAQHKHSHREEEVFSCRCCSKTFLYRNCLLKHQNLCQGGKKGGGNKGQPRGHKRKKSEQPSEQEQSHKRPRGGKKASKGGKPEKEGKPPKVKSEIVQQEEGPDEGGQEGEVPKEEEKINENRAERGKKKRADGKPENTAGVKPKKRKLLKDGIKIKKEPKDGSKAREKKTKDGVKPGEEKAKKSKVGIKRGPYKKRLQVGAPGDKKKIVRVKIKGVKLKPGPKKKQGMKDKK